MKESSTATEEPPCSWPVLAEHCGNVPDDDERSDGLKSRPSTNGVSMADGEIRRVCMQMRRSKRQLSRMMQNEAFSPQAMIVEAVVLNAILHQPVQRSKLENSRRWRAVADITEKHLWRLQPRADERGEEAEG